MSYTKKDFGRDLFFLIGFLDGCIDKHNNSFFTKNKISRDRFEKFVRYCDKRFSTKRDIITG